MALTRATDKIIANADGNLNLSGIVTASSFRGDGSQLTGIDASTLKNGSDTKAQANASGVVVTGVLTATSYSGDGSNLTNLPAGLGTALSSTQTSPLNKLYYTNEILSIGATVTVDHPATGTGAYTQYADIRLEEGADLIIEDGDDVIPDILGLGTDGGGLGAGGSGRIRVDSITNKNANGAPNFPNGLTGTAGTFTGNLNVGGVLTYEDVTNVDSIGVITARSGIRIGATGANTLITGNGTGIGIGTASASSKLHIESSGETSITFEGSSTVGAALQLKNNSNTANHYNQILGADAGGQTTSAINFYNADNANNEGFLSFITRPSGGAPTERLRIGSSGQIGIAGANYGTSGQVLTSQGSGSAVQWANAGGITHARGYRLTSSADASGGAMDLTNWGYEDSSSFSGHLGSGWSLPSSGVFTFPTTGIYDVSMIGMMRQLNDSNAWCGVQGKATTNNSSYSVAFEIYQQIVQASGSSNQYVNFYGHCILDVTDTSNVKFKVTFFADQNEQVYLHGVSNYNQTALKFTRLGDT
tara:strand:- start:16 stop:1611 length:1596 start_codon:yes stop_codon:yes gene_type:complete